MKSKATKTNASRSGELQGFPPECSRKGTLEVCAVCVLLAILVFGVFGQTGRFGFVNFDDHEYVYENPAVSKGLSLAGLKWAFTHVHGANWHPLTTLSHMLDSQLFGLWAGGHHLTNVLLHAAAVVLLFLMLRELTGAFWRPAFAAALFAIHPLRAESVAWISERKDVLSGVFFMLTLWAYARYAKGGTTRRGYAWVAGWLVPGLLSKPMLVTTPFILLLLDFWPLGRLRERSQFKALIIEKLPLVTLAAISSAATLIAQQGAIQTWERFPLPTRLANAAIACAVYLKMLIFPAGLAPLYPATEGGWPAWQVAAATLVSAMLVVLAWCARRRRPFVTVGVLWYFGMLAPVIGIIQVGGQAYADRYTYLPQIGLGVAITWLAAEWVQGRRQRRVALSGLAAAVLAALSAAAFAQTGHWRDNVTLWTRALKFTKENAVAHHGLGMALFDLGRTEDAVAQFRQALRIVPTYADAFYNIGHAMDRSGRMAEAIPYYREAIRINPVHAKAHNNLGNAFLQSGQIDQAMAQYREAVRSDPSYVDARINLGEAHRRVGKLDDAIAILQQALQIEESAAGHNNLGICLLARGQTEEATAHFREALRIDPSNADARSSLGSSFFQQGRAKEAIEQLEQALALQPASVTIQTNLAWMLSAAPDPALRNGPRAIWLARQATESSGGNDPAILRTLAAAYAAGSDFASAVGTARHAAQIADYQSDRALRDALEVEIKLYEARQPIPAR